MGITVTDGITFGSGFSIKSGNPPASSYYLALGGETTPYIIVYPWSSSGYGSKFADPSTAPDAVMPAIQWARASAQ